MPNRDGTGPDGRGPLTGRGLGLCRRDADFIPMRRGRSFRRRRFC